MFSSPDDPSNPTTRISTLPIAVFLYLGAEVLLAALISLLLITLALIKRFLPKPPRDLTNDTVVITGAGSGLGEAVAEEFLKAGCIVACVDENLNLNSIKDAVPDLNSRNESIEELQTRNEFHQVSNERKIFAYKCDSTNRQDILNVAQEIRRDIGRVDVLITCTGSSNQNILDVVSTNLMSHYWAMLAFVPAMIQSKHSNIVAVIPAASSEDAYMSSKAAISGLVEAIAQQLSNTNHLTFTTVAPQARSMKMNKQQIARDIVNAVRRDQRTLSTNWGSNILYPACFMLHKAITDFTSWLYG